MRTFFITLIIIALSFTTTLLAQTRPQDNSAAKKPENTKPQPYPATINDAIKRLKEGNQRFVSGKTLHPRQSPERIKEVSEGQRPYAIIMGCSDSRVPNEIIFDEGLGDLFIVRTAGQVPAAASFGSIEFAEEVLGARLIVVLGHTRCGAVSAACNYENPVPGHIIQLVNSIKEAAIRAKDQEGDYLLNAVKENVRAQVRQLRHLEPILAARLREGKIKIIGAVYHLETGIVEFLDEASISSR